MRATHLAAVGGAGLVAFDADTLVRESGIEAERVLRYALVDADADGWLRAIYEKPDPDHPLAQSPQRWVSMNLWSFTPESSTRARASCHLREESSSSRTP